MMLVKEYRKVDNILTLIEPIINKAHNAPIKSKHEKKNRC